MDHELPSPASRTLMCEAEKVESFGFGLHPGRSRQGLMPERYETRLLRVEGQSEPFESLGKHLQHLLGILLILKADHRVIGVPDFKRLAPEARLHFALEPFVKYEVKVYVGPCLTSSPLSRRLSD